MEAWPFADALRTEFDRLLSRRIAEGAEAGEFEAADAKIAALAIGGMISWAYTWHRPQGRLDLDGMGAEMARLALRMVGAKSIPG